MADLFVSYKAEDRTRVRPLVEALQADGLDVWWDAHIEAGVDWRETIASNLDSARCVLVVWSKRSIGPEGRFVRDEAARAVKRNAYLPVAIDKVDPPLGFGETQCLPLTNWKGSREDPRYLALLDAARHVGGGAPVRRAPTAAPAATSRGVDRRLVIGGGAVAGLAVAGGVGWAFLRGSPANANSVAVMPFANLSGDPGQTYFSDGMAEELRSALARINGLKVIGRTSSELLRNDDVTAAARKLEVGSIVTGSVRRSPNTIRVSAQLVDGATGVEKWSQSFDRPNGDALAIQSNIAQAVVQQLRSQLGAGDRAALAIGGTSNSAALDLMLKAEAASDGSEAGYRTQIALYDAAIALDPNYAAAYAGKARVATGLVGFYGRSIDELSQGMNAAAGFARKAIALAPDLAEAHAALAYNRSSVLDLKTAWAEYQKALASPGCPPKTMLSAANFMLSMGNEARARSVWQSASAIDPLNPSLIITEANMAVSARRYGEAIPLHRKYLDLKPKSATARGGLASMLAATGQYAEALKQTELLPPGYPTYFVVRAQVAWKTGDRARAMAILDDARKTFGPNGGYQYAEIRAMMGDNDGAMAELENAFKYRDPGLDGLIIDNLFDGLKDDPRFKSLVARIGFPQI